MKSQKLPVCCMCFTVSVLCNMCILFSPVATGQWTHSLKMKKHFECLELTALASVFIVMLIPIVSGHMSQDGHYDTDVTNTVNLLLLGKSGHGKSSLGNHLLGRKKFKSGRSPNSVTKECDVGIGKIGDQRIAVVDTPGVMDTEMDHEDFLRHLSEAIAFSPKGYHAILLVFSSITRVTEEEKRTLRVLESLFGEEMWHYVIFVFTFRDLFAKDFDYENEVESEFETYLRHMDWDMQRYFAHSNNRNILIDSTEKDAAERKRINFDILDQVEEVIRRKRGKCYSNEHFERAQKKMMEEEEANLRRKHGRSMEVKKERGFVRRVLSSVVSYIFSGLMWFYERTFRPLLN